MGKTSIKEELYEYICPKKRVRINAKRVDAIKNDLPMYAMITLLLIIFSLPLFLEKTLICCVLVGAYIFALILNLTDKDPYTRGFLYFGATILYFAIVFSYMVVDGIFERFQLLVIFPLILFTVILILFYEIFVIYNLVSRKYTARNEDKRSHPTAYTTLGTLTGGLFASHLVSRFSPLLADSIWVVWLSLFACALAFWGAFICFQKYLLYRFTKEKNTNEY